VLCEVVLKFFSPASFTLTTRAPPTMPPKTIAKGKGKGKAVKVLGRARVLARRA